MVAWARSNFKNLFQSCEWGESENR